MPVTINGTTGITSPGGDTSTSLTTSGLTIGTTALGAGNATRFKNRIINGDMRIDQRNAGASQAWGSTTVAGNYAGYSVDRWAIQNYSSTASTGVAFTTQQNAGSVTPPAGFVNYIGATVTTAQASLSATTVSRVYQLIEGLNTADLGWGTANAKTVTLSFWVRSSLTGTFGGMLLNSAANRCYVFSYSIPTANTWTQISVTIAGDTTGTWLTTNGIGISVNFSLGANSASLGTAGSWGSTLFYGPTGQTNVISTSGATFYITGVQLEVGTSATGFEYVDYTTQLAMCQRYYEVIKTTLYSVYGMYAASSYFVTPQFKFSVTKRATPSVPDVTTVGNALWAIPGILVVSGTGVFTFSASSITTDGCSFTQTRSSGGTTPTAGNIYLLEGAVNFIGSSEL